MHSKPRYQALADDLRQAMQDGRLSAGEQLLPLRQAASTYGFSINTVLAAYQQLEAHGLVESRPQAGYFVRARLTQPSTTASMRSKASAQLPSSSALGRISAVIRAQQQPDVVDLSLAASGGSFLPLRGAGSRAQDTYFPDRQLGKILKSLASTHTGLMTHYALPPGSLLLRQGICRNTQHLGIALEPHEVVLTNGCMEALHLALRAVAKPGDTIGLESPTFFNLISELKFLGMKVVELPTHPITGLMLDTVEELLAVRKLQAIVTMPNVHNPLGTSMPLAHKKRLAILAQTYRIPVIEDAVYAELQFTTPLQPAVKSFDTEGWVLLCSSFSKTLAPGLRIGWMAPGRFQEHVEALKFSSTGGQPPLLEEALGRYLAEGGYEKQLRKLRRIYGTHVNYLRDMVQRHFPPGTQATDPVGGFLLWAELPDGCDADRLFTQAMHHKICITPGNLFSPNGRHTRCIRLSAGHGFGERHIQALVKLGELAMQQWRTGGSIKA